VRILRALGLCLIALSIAGCVSVPVRDSVDAGVSFDFFYSSLGAHGQWLVSAEYGRVWQPSIERADWNPYYDGHWIYTDLGWTWVSDYEWGAIPYHYGTWTVDADLGWVWVPGSVWAPAWVIFSSGPDYIGWAPVPVGYSVGMSIDAGRYGPDRFVFVASRDFLAPRVRGYAVPVTNTRRIIETTRVENTLRVENNVIVNRGPDVDLVQRASGRRVEVESIERVPRVAPTPHPTRDDLRMDAAGPRTRPRAAEPLSGSERQPPALEPGGQRANPPSGAVRQAQPGNAPRAEDPGRARPREPQIPDEQEGPPNHPRRPDQATDPGKGPSDDSQAKAEAKAQAEAKKKADAQADSDAKQKAKGKKKAKPRPKPSDDKPPNG
jgi:hypothetical protein